jgi:WD40 repeat protein
VETCTDVGAQVVAGTRRYDPGGELLTAFGESLEILDLDDPLLFSGDDLAAYALATLRLEGDERDGNPYADLSAARPVAERIAVLSDRNFLIAGLTARAHGLHDQHAADPASLSFTATVDAAMREYLQRLSAVAGVPAEDALTALAFAEAPGIPVSLWRDAMDALGAGQYSDGQLVQFARSSAASFLVESGGDGQAAVFRLFHQALNDALLRARSHFSAPRDDERALTRVFIAAGRRNGWGQAPGYLLRSLASHAARAGMIDDLLAEDAYLLHADLRRLLPLADRTSSPAGRQHARLLRLTPRAIAADAPTRIALFSVTETLEDLGQTYTACSSSAPYRARWAKVAPRTERSALDGHADRVWTVCAVNVQHGRPLLASGSLDGTVRIWDPADGTEQAVLRGHHGSVNAVCGFAQDGRILLASGGDDQVVRIWDVADGSEQAALHGHGDSVNAVCAFSARDGRTLLASGGDDQVVRIWDPADGTEQIVLRGHSDSVRAVCSFIQGGRALLASGGDDQVVRIWDPADGTEQAVLSGHDGDVNAVCTFAQDNRILLASGGDDRTVRIWNPADGTQLAALEGHDDSVRAVCAFNQDGRPMLAACGIGRRLRIWDPADGTQQATLHGHNYSVNAVCAFTAQDGSVLLVSGSSDRTVRIWDPADGTGQAVQSVRNDPVRAACAFIQGGRTLLATGSDGDLTVRIWDPANGTEQAALHGNDGSVRAVCAFTAWNRRTLLATGGDDEAVRIWDPADGTEQGVLRGCPRSFEMTM